MSIHRISSHAFQLKRLNRSYYNVFAKPNTSISTISLKIGVVKSDLAYSRAKTRCAAGCLILTKPSEEKASCHRLKKFPMNTTVLDNACASMSPTSHVY